MVGKSGNSAERAAPVTPITRSVPAAICGVTTSAGENIRSMRPPSRSVTAGPVPRYGTCSSSTPAIWPNSAPERCDAEPAPDEPNVSLPGLALA